MILGRWSLAAFVKYIRPQVMEWAAGMSMSMLQSPDFRHANPAIQPTPDLDSLQANLDAAIKTPEETSLNGSTRKFVSDSVLNLEFLARKSIAQSLPSTAEMNQPQRHQAHDSGRIQWCWEPSWFSLGLSAHASTS
ncbi:hypothetical protein ACA910_008146 [Epithemia clementina (nom. ined.)]